MAKCEKQRAVQVADKEALITCGNGRTGTLSGRLTTALLESRAPETSECSAKASLSGEGQDPGGESLGS